MNKSLMELRFTDQAIVVQVKGLHALVEYFRAGCCIRVNKSIYPKSHEGMDRILPDRTYA